MSEISPRLIFFTELETDALKHLVAQPGVLDNLAVHGYSVAMGMLDLTTERAEVVRMLSERGIGVTAWLLLPEEEGYWFNVENYPQAVAHYRVFRDWARAEGLQFPAVGLHIEPSLQQLHNLQPIKLLPFLSRFVEARRNALYPAAYEAYFNLSAEIRSDGYEVHTYQYPFIVDDRRATTTLVQRTLNVVDLPADVEVLMCYSSMIPGNLLGSDLGGALVAEYGLYADSLGLGSTGGGIVMDPATGERAPKLEWEAFARDLRIAAEFTDLIHVFSLEGCVWSGYFDRLHDFDWLPPPRIALRHRLIMRGLRSGIGVVLWWSRFGLTVMGWLGWVVVAAIFIRRWIERTRSAH